MPDFNDMLRRFFEAQPRWLTSDADVTYLASVDGEEPQPGLPLAAEKAFLRWAVDTGQLPHWQRVPRFRALLDGTSQEEA
jgi:hypothetical protein